MAPFSDHIANFRLLPIRVSDYQLTLGHESLLDTGARRTGEPLVTLGAIRSIRSGFPIDAIGTVQSGSPVNAILAICAVCPGYSIHPIGPVNAGSPSHAVTAGRAGRPIYPIGPVCSVGPVDTRRPINTIYAGLAPGSDFPHHPGLTVNTGYTIRAAGTQRTVYAVLTGLTLETYTGLANLTLYASGTGFALGPDDLPGSEDAVILIIQNQMENAIRDVRIGYRISPLAPLATGAPVTRQAGIPLRAGHRLHLGNLGADQSRHQSQDAGKNLCGFTHGRSHVPLIHV